MKTLKSRDELFKLLREHAIATNDRDMMFCALALSEDPDGNELEWVNLQLDGVATLLKTTEKDVAEVRDEIIKCDGGHPQMAHYSARSMVDRLEAALDFARGVEANLATRSAKAGAR